MTHETHSSPAVARTPVNKHRIEALADGLFAIVMTLLVLELKVPDLPHSATNAEIIHALAPLWRVLFSFVLTFGLSSLFWLTQQQILGSTLELDRIGAGLHLAAMMFVSLLPFSTAMLGHYINRGIGMGLYFGNQTLIAFLLSLVWIREQRRGNVMDLPLPDRRRMTLRTVGLTATCFGACIVGSLVPHYAFYGALPGILGVRLYMRRMK